MNAAKYVFTFNPYNNPVESYSYYNDSILTEVESEAKKKSSEICEAE